jgi:hypothetical protein
MNRKENEILDTAQAILGLPHTLGNKGSTSLHKITVSD